MSLSTRCMFAALAAAVAATPAASDDLPVRKPGQWKITSISAAHGMITTEACIGPADSIAAVPGAEQCAAPEVQHADDQIIVNVTCRTAHGREKTSTLFTGDFTTWYRGIVKMTFDPPSQGRANLGITLDAKYVGACRDASKQSGSEGVP